MSTDSSALATRASLTWLWRLTFGLYLALLFAGTHLPLRLQRLAAHNHDKLLHFAGYGLLGALIGWQLGRGAPSRRQMLRVWAAILLWAGVDELTQPLVGRTLDVYDWIADGLGSAVGLMAGLGVIAARPVDEPVNPPESAS